MPPYWIMRALMFLENNTHGFVVIMGKTGHENLIDEVGGSHKN
jgi:hypothetical protein